MSKELGSFYVAFITVQLYIQLEQFIILQVTLPTLYHQVTSKFMLVLKKVTSEPLENCKLVDPQGLSWISPYQTHNNIEYLQLEIVKINTHRDKNIVVPTICGL